MIKKNICVFLTCILLLSLVGCGNKPVEMSKEVESSGDEFEVSKEVDTEQENSGTSDDTTEQENESISNTSDTENNSNTTTGNTTTKPSTGNTDSNKKPSTGSTGNSGTTNNSGSTGNTGNTSNNNSGTTTQPSTPVHEHKWVEVTEEEIHYYAWRTLCGKCGLDMTDMSDEELTIHVTFECQSRYSTKYIEVDFVTENVVKTPVVTGYKCECGAEK